MLTHDEQRLGRGKRNYKQSDDEESYLGIKTDPYLTVKGGTEGRSGKKSKMAGDVADSVLLELPSTLPSEEQDGSCLGYTTETRFDYGDMPWPSQATVEYFLVRLMDNNFRLNFDPEKDPVHCAQGFRQICNLAKSVDSNVDHDHPLMTALTLGSNELRGPTDAWRRLVYYLSVPPPDLDKKKILAAYLGDCGQAIRFRTSSNTRRSAWTHRRRDVASRLPATRGTPQVVPL